jgi:hypothetical protein
MFLDQLDKASLGVIPNPLKLGRALLRPNQLLLSLLFEIT